MGKAHYKGKDLTGVRSLQRKLTPDNVGSEKREPTSLRGIANKAKTNKRHRFRDLYGCLNAELLLYCWHDLNKDAASGVETAAEGCTLRVKSCIADASTTEEPDEGKLHVWDCAGGAG